MVEPPPLSLQYLVYDSPPAVPLPDTIDTVLLVFTIARVLESTAPVFAYASISYSENPIV